MFISKTFYPLLCTISTQEDPSQHDGKNIYWDVKNQNKQTNSIDIILCIMSILIRGNGGSKIIKNKLYKSFRRLRNQNEYSLHILRLFATMVFLLRFVFPVFFSRHGIGSVAFENVSFLWCKF